MTDDRDNEHLKLTANWVNTIATATMTVGTFVPAFQWIYGILPKDTDWALVVTLGVICILLGIFIHLMGHLALGGLK
jgi:hypothetical protein